MPGGQIWGPLQRHPTDTNVREAIMKTKTTDRWSSQDGAGVHRSESLGRKGTPPKRQPLCERTVAVAMGVLAVIAAAATLASAGGPLEGLAKPQEGRSMRATSTMRVGEVRRGGDEKKLNPKADPRGDLDEAEQLGQLPGAPRARRTCCWTRRARASSPTSGSRSSDPSRRTGPSKGSANHQEMLLRMYWDGSERPGRRGAGRRLLRQLLRQAQRGHQPAGDRRGRRFLQLLLAHAVPQVGPDRDRQPERQADQPALLQHRLDQEGQAARGHALLLRPVPPGVPGRRRARTT